MTTTKELVAAIENGQDALNDREVTAACDHWLTAWEMVKQLATPEMRSVGDFDNFYSITYAPIHDWSQDFEMELGNAARVDPKYHEIRLKFACEFNERFPEGYPHLTRMMMRAQREALFELGRQVEAEAVFASAVERSPKDTWSFIGWSDMYWLYAPKGSPKDHARAEELLLEAPSDEPQDRDVVLERLESLYEDRGKPDKRAAIAEQLKATRERRELTGGMWAPSDPEPVQTPVASKKVGRNDPCPCGSGKKFKKCRLGKAGA